MKQIILPILGTIIFIVLIGLFVTNPEKYIKKQTPQNKQKIVKIQNLEIIVDLADTPEKRSKGLSGRESLDEKEGMLFILDGKDQTPIFWMKDMLIPIDIIWINSGKIVQIDRAIQIPEKDTSDADLTRYSPEVSIDYVLEVNSGFSDKYELKAGDSVDLSQI